MIKNFLIILFLISNSSAQKNDRYQNLHFEINAFNPITNTEIFNYYDAKTGIDVQISTDYDYGYFYVGFRQFSFIKQVNSTSDFTSKYIFLGWETDLLEYKEAQLKLGFHIGSFEMEFDNETRWYYENESEFAFSIQSSLSYPLFDSVTLRIQSENTQLFTFHKTYINTVSAGVDYTFRTPNWLKQFLN